MLGLVFAPVVVTGAYGYNAKPYLLKVSKTEKDLHDLKLHLLEAGTRDSLPGI